MSTESPPSEMTAFEAIHSLRSVRQFKPDPIPVDYIRRILRAGIMACSAINTQPWEFVVLTDQTDQKLRGQIAEWISEAHVSSLAKKLPRKELVVDGSGRPLRSDAIILTTVPCIILVLWNPERGIWSKDEYRQNPGGTLEEIRPSQGRGSSLFPACQNIMLAAKALGLGSLFYRSVILAEKEIKQLLHIPPQMFLETAVLIGYPAEKLGKPRRRPIEEITHWTFWENRGPIPNPV